MPYHEVNVTIVIQIFRIDTIQYGIVNNDRYPATESVPGIGIPPA